MSNPPGPYQPPYPQQPGQPDPSGQQPGYPGQQPGQPDPSGQQPGYPGQQPGYPGQQPYPGGQGGQPGPGQSAPPLPNPAQPGFPPQGPPPGYPTQPYATTDASVPSSPYAQTAPPAKKPRRRGVLIGGIAAAVVLLLLVGGGIAGGVAGTQANAPERQVEAYLDALVDGDAEDALAVSNAEVGDDGVLLTDDVYGEADDRISGYELGDAVITGDTAEVPAEVTQGEDSYDTTFTLEKSGKAFVVFDTWSLRAPELGVVSYSVEGPEDSAVAVAGVDTTAIAPGDGGAVELPALPGTYTVALAGESEYLAAEPLTVTVTGFGADAVSSSVDAAGEETTTLTVALTEAAVTAGTAAVDAYLDGCAASTDFRPEGCPFVAQGETAGFEYTNCVWTLDPRPSFTIGEYADGEWPVSTDSSGSASLACDVRDPSTGATGTATAGPMTVTLDGAVTAFAEDGATYAP